MGSENSADQASDLESSWLCEGDEACGVDMKVAIFGLSCQLRCGNTAPGAVPVARRSPGRKTPILSTLHDHASNIN